VDRYTLYEAKVGSVLASHVRVADEVDAALRVSETLAVLVIPPPVRVMVALFVPIEAVAVFTLTVRVLLFEAERGVIVNQLAFSLTLQFVFDVTASVCVAGLAAP
jgi:hypothetical protein